MNEVEEIERERRFYNVIMALGIGCIVLGVVAFIVDIATIGSMLGILIGGVSMFVVGNVAKEMQNRYIRMLIDMKEGGR